MTITPESVSTQSTAPATLPAGTSLAKETVGSVIYQPIKIVLGADGVATAFLDGDDSGAFVQLPANVTAALLAGATAANQSTANTSLAAILAKLSSDPATQTTLAAILAKLIAAPATEAKQDTGNTSLASIVTALASQATAANQTSEQTLIGAVAETAPASDTASSGLNGRLQRIAQRLSSLITAIGTPFQAGGSIGNTSFGATQSGTWTVQPGNTANTTAWKVDGSAVTQPVSASALPLPSGAATAAKQPALGTAGTPSADVLSVQGITSGTPVQVGGSSVQITPSITVTTASAYASGNLIGGKLTLTNAMRISGGSGTLQSIFLQDVANQKFAADILIFDSDPSNGTYTDKTAFTYNASDRSKCVRKISIAATDWTTIQGGSAVAIADVLVGGKPIASSGSRNLYALIVNTGTTPTFVAGTDLTVRFGFLQD